MLLDNSESGYGKNLDTNLTESVIGRAKFCLNGSPHAMCLLQSPYQTEKVGRLPDP